MGLPLPPFTLHAIVLSVLPDTLGVLCFERQPGRKGYGHDDDVHGAGHHVGSSVLVAHSAHVVVVRELVV